VSTPQQAMDAKSPSCLLVFSKLVYVTTAFSPSLIMAMAGSFGALTISLFPHFQNTGKIKERDVQNA
jgi:hypothetical protein